MNVLSQTTVIVDVVIVNSVMWAERWDRVKGAKAEGWGSCYQIGDWSGWEFATISKKLTLQVRWGSYYSCKGFNNNCMHIV